MKKLLYIFLCFIVFNCFRYSVANADIVMEPAWAEFCPPLYINAVFNKDKSNSPFYIESNYWALRKVKFEKSISHCKANSANYLDLNACYKKVAIAEKKKTNKHTTAKFKNKNTQSEEYNSEYNYTYGY